MVFNLIEPRKIKRMFPKRSIKFGRHLPIYTLQFRCPFCGAVFEVLRKSHQGHLPPCYCPACPGIAHPTGKRTYRFFKNQEQINEVQWYSQH